MMIILVLKIECVKENSKNEHEEKQIVIIFGDIPIYSVEVMVP